MQMRGLLKTPDCVYFLSPKITTVGRENCDIVIQNQTVDDQHAIIEYSDAEDMYILRDLDTNNGTYVNECRIQNASVRLSPGDTVRFGFHGVPHEFGVEAQQNSNGLTYVLYPPVGHQRPTWQSPHLLRTITDPASSSSGANLPSVFAQKAPVSVPPAGVFAAWTQPHPPPAARPARPSSAGRRQNRDRGGWIGGQRNASPGRDSPVSEIFSPDKLGDEKDGMIENLRHQVAGLQTQMNTLTADANVRAKLLQLETEVAAKRAEVSQLRDRLQQPTGTTTDSLELSSVRSEVDRLRKDKNITNGLVAQLQRDLANKDATISRLTREVEGMRKEMDVKDTNINNLHDAVKQEQERSRIASSTDSRDKELSALRQKFKVAENKVQEQSGFIQSLKADLESSHAELRRIEQASEEAEQSLKDRDQQLLDLQRVERIARVDMQEATKRYERLRNRAMQIAFSIGGADSPGGEVKDDKLVEMLRRILDERNSAKEQLQAARGELESKGSFRSDLTAAVRSWSEHLSAMQTRLNEAKMPSGSLADEITMLVTEPVHETLQPIKDAFLTTLKLQLEWHTEVEMALNACGVNTRLSSERPKQHIADLSMKLEAARSESEQLRSRLESLAKEHEEEVARMTAALTADKEEALKEAKEGAELSEEERIREAVEAALSEEKEKFEEEVKAAKAKEEELGASIAELQAALLTKQETYDAGMKEAELNLLKIEALQARVEDLEREVAVSRTEARRMSEQAELPSSRASPSSSLQKELEAAREEVQRLTALQDGNAALGERLAALEAELEELRGAKEAEEAALKAQVGELEVAKIDLCARVEALTSELEGHVTSLPEAGSRSASRLLGEVDRLQTALREAAESKEQLEAQLAELQARPRSRDSRRSSFANLRAELDASLEQTLELTRELEGLRARGASPEAEEDRATDLREQLRASENTVTRLVGELELAKSAVCQLEEVERLREELEATRLALRLAREESGPMEAEADVGAFQEQVRQHSRTICALEERLKEVMRENQAMQGQIADLKRDNRILRKKRGSRAESEADGERSLQLANANANQNEGGGGAIMEIPMPRPHVEISTLERSLLALRQENANMKKDLHEKERLIIALRQDLSGTEARLSDVRSEMDEAQKQLVTDAQSAAKRSKEKLEETRDQLAKLSLIVDDQRETIARKEKEIKLAEDALAKLKVTCEEQSKRLEMLQKESMEAKSKMASQLEDIEEQGRITSELCAVGAQCRGERHEQIISHQKEALSDMRMRIKKLELVRAPQTNFANWNNSMVANVKDMASESQGMPSHDQAVQQVVLLKKELAEMRARQALQEARVPSSTPSLPAIVGPQGSNSSNLVAARTTTDTTLQDPSIERMKANLEARFEEERSAHNMTMAALEMSEQTLLDLLRAVASSVELETIGGLRSLAHLDEDERLLVQAERVEAIQKVCQRIKMLRDRLDRKESLMTSYEQDLVRLQQAEELAKRKHAQVETLVQDVRRKTDEAQMLRDSLHNTKEILNREKMLNTAIKQKKTFHMEVPKMPKGPTPQRGTGPKQHCPIPDPFNKAEAQKKKAKERERRKNFEIETLKSKLTSREQELCRATSRLVSMETTLAERLEGEEGLNADSQETTT